MAMPKISVIMPVFNNASHLREAIESICGQTFSDFEFLIVNDGSTDGSGDIIDSYTAADDRIRVFHQANQGMIASLNKAIAEARAPIIARMDGDDASAPERFTRQYGFLAEHQDYGVVGCQCRFMNEKGETISRHIHYPTDHAAFLRAVEDRHPLMNHPAAMIRRDLLIDLGGYRPAFRHCEDYDLWLRLVERTKICSLPDVLNAYRFHDGQVSNRHYLMQQIRAEIAYEAHRARLAGLPDPTKGLDTLPALADLDKVFQREGLARIVRARVVPRIFYVASALRGGGFELFIDHIRDGAALKRELWAACARLMKLGMPGRALRMALALAVSGRTG
jgi:glycosyltransferase involved in cell wall biosynthesis